MYQKIQNCSSLRDGWWRGKLIKLVEYQQEIEEIINKDAKEIYERCIFCYDPGEANNTNNKPNCKGHTKGLHIGNCTQVGIQRFIESLSYSLE